MKVLIIILFILFSFNWSVKAEECNCKELEERVYELERSLFWLNQELSKDKSRIYYWYSLEYPIIPMQEKFYDDYKKSGNAEVEFIKNVRQGFKDKSFDNTGAGPE